MGSNPPTLTAKIGPKLGNYPRERFKPVLEVIETDCGSDNYSTAQETVVPESSNNSASNNSTVPVNRFAGTLNSSAEPLNSSAEPLNSFVKTSTCVDLIPKSTSDKPGSDHLDTGVSANIRDPNFGPGHDETSGKAKKVSLKVPKAKITFNRKLKDFLSPKGLALFKKEMPASPAIGCENVDSTPKSLKRQQNKHAIHFQATKKWSKLLERFRLLKKHNDCYIQRVSVCDDPECPVKVRKVHRISASRTFCRIYASRIGCKTVSFDLVNLQEPNQSSEAMGTLKITPLILNDGPVRSIYLGEKSSEISANQICSHIDESKTLVAAEEDTEVKPKANWDVPISYTVGNTTFYKFRDVWPVEEFSSSQKSRNPDHTTDCVPQKEVTDTSVSKGKNTIIEIETVSTEVSTEVDQNISKALVLYSGKKQPRNLTTTVPSRMTRKNASAIVSDCNINSTGTYKLKGLLWIALNMHFILGPHLNASNEFNFLLIDLTNLKKSRIEREMNEYMEYMRSVITLQAINKTGKLVDFYDNGYIDDVIGITRKPAPVFICVSQKEVAQEFPLSDPELPVPDQLSHLKAVVRTQDVLMDRYEKTLVDHFYVADQLEKYLNSLLQQLRATAKYFVKICTDMAAQDLSNGVLDNYEDRLRLVSDELAQMQTSDLSARNSLLKMQFGHNKSLQNVLFGYKNAYDVKAKSSNHFHQLWVQILGKKPLTPKKLEDVVGCSSLENQNDFYEECYLFKAFDVLSQKCDRLKTLYKKVSKAREQLQLTYVNVISSYVKHVYDLPEKKTIDNDNYYDTNNDSDSDSDYDNDYDFDIDYYYGKDNNNLRRTDRSTS